MNNDLIKRVFKNEHDYCNLFTTKQVTETYIRFCDDKLPDMWDHNFTELFGDLTPEDFANIKAFSEQRGEKHIKISSFNRLKVLSILGYEHSIILTMAASTINPKPLKIGNISYKNLKENPDLVNDFLNLELKYYGHVWGNDFVARMMYRYFMIAKENNQFNYFGCYYNNKLIAHCYAFQSEGVIALDGLLVDEKFRHLNVASNLVKHIQSYHQNCPIYLHADDEETSKYIYQDLGFETLYQRHEYLLLKNKEE